MTFPSRYLAVITAQRASLRSNDRPIDLPAPQGMDPAFQSVALSVYVDPGTALLTLEDGRGILIGHLFPKHGSVATRTSPLHSIAAGPFGSRGAVLSRGYWGGYVAFGQSDDQSSAEAIRDPSGALQCYYLKVGEAIFASNDVSLLLLAAGQQPEIDWQQVRQHLLAPELKLTATCLKGVLELLPGCRLEVSGSKVEIDEIWSPWQFHRPIWDGTDPLMAAERVRDAVEVATRAWANVYGRVLVELSGGLDSSIVATALTNQAVQYDALTFFTSDAVGDERRYARAVADRFGITLAEGLLDVDHVDLARSDAAHLPRPVARLFTQDIDRLSLNAVAEFGSRVIFHGGGGDNVFCYLQSVVPIVDRYRSVGMKPEVIRTIVDIAKLSGCGIGEVSWKAIRRAMRRGAGFRWKPEPDFLRLDDRADPVLSHPWLQPPASALPGMTGHIAALLRVQNYLHGFAREQVLPTIAPLLSQPVVETCLGIPSWLWCEGGVNRSIARRAFRQTLPPEILSRRSKGSPDSFVCQIYDRNRLEIRERLLSGPLYGTGILDENALEHFLADPKPASGLSYLRVLTLLATSNWITSWSADRILKANSSPTLVS